MLCTVKEKYIKRIDDELVPSIIEISSKCGPLLSALALFSKALLYQSNFLGVLFAFRCSKLNDSPKSTQTCLAKIQLLRLRSLPAL